MPYPDPANTPGTESKYGHRFLSAHQAESFSQWRSRNWGDGVHFDRSRSDVGTLLGKLLQQSRGVFQIAGLKTLGEPGVGISQQLSRFVWLALPLP